MADQETLFQLSLDSDSSEPAMLKAARAQIKALQDQRLIKPQHLMTCQLVLSLAEAIGKAAAKGQASAMSFASKELREAMALLPQPVAVSSMEELQQLLRESEKENTDDRSIYA